MECVLMEQKPFQIPSYPLSAMVLLANTDKNTKANTNVNSLLMKYLLPGAGCFVSYTLCGMVSFGCVVVHMCVPSSKNGCVWVSDVGLRRARYTL